MSGTRIRKNTLGGKKLIRNPWIFGNEIDLNSNQIEDGDELNRVLKQEEQSTGRRKQTSEEHRPGRGLTAKKNDEGF